MNGFDLSTITGVYFGSTQYNAIYYGSTKIWPTGSVTPPQPTIQYVDMGLPSGTLWATCNLGASSETESGDYYSWGNTEGHTATNGSFDYNFGTTWNIGGTESYSITTGATLFEDIPLANDAVYAEHGDPWHIPSMDEYKELFDDDYTTVTITADYNNTGVGGVLVTSLANGNTVFLPAGGRASGTSVSDASQCYYWTTEWYDHGEGKDAYCIKISSSVNTAAHSSRRYGMLLRPVRHRLSYVPDGYTELTYIQSTTNQYIDLNILLYDVLNKQYDVQLKFNVQGPGSDQTQATLFGCQSEASPWPGTFIRLSQPTATNVTGRYIGGSSKDNNLGSINTDIELGPRSSGYNVRNLNNSGLTHNFSTSLFCAFSDVNRTPYRFVAAKLYYFKLFVVENGAPVLVRNMVPCIDPNNVVGMYDTVNDVFYSSPNGSAFTAGPSVF